MDGMKKMMMATVAIIIAALVFAFMLNLTKSDLQNKNNEALNSGSSSSSQVQSEKQEILFFSYNLDLYNSPDLTGFVIDSSGKKSDYCLKKIMKVYTPEEAFSMVLEQKKDLKFEDFASSSDISNLTEVLGYVDQKAEFNVEDDPNGSGVSTLYGVSYKSGKPELIKIYSEGKEIETPKDTNARVIQKYFVKKQNKEESKAAAIDESDEG